MTSALHLWYLNNIIIVFIVAPILVYVFRSKLFTGILLFMICIFYYYNFKEYKIETAHIIKFRFVSFFVIGGFLAINKNLLGRIVNLKMVIGVLCFIPIIVEFMLPILSKNYPLVYVLNSLLVPVIIFMGAYYLTSKYIKLPEVNYKRSEHYLLYIIHPFMLSLICKMLFYNFQFSIRNYVLFFIIVSCITYLIIIFNRVIYSGLNKFLPAFCRVVL